MTEVERLKYDKMYKEVTTFALKEIQLHDRKVSRAGWWLRLKLRRAARKLEHVVQAYPDGYSSMWFLGKIYERLNDPERYFSWMARSYEANPSQPDVAREASMAAMNLGRTDDAVAYAFRAAQVGQQHAGLQANLALAYLLAGKFKLAKEAIGKSLESAPNDKVSRTLSDMIVHFAASGMEPPRTTRALTEYWRKRPKI